MLPCEELTEIKTQRNVDPSISSGHVLNIRRPEYRAMVLAIDRTVVRP
jgi:hypothetical protein